MKKISLFIVHCSLLTALCACGGYQTPPRNTWNSYLVGASFGEMSAPAKIAKRPIFQGRNGVALTSAMAPTHMQNLENELENNLRKPGIQIQMAGTDILIVLVRDAFMERDVPNISQTGDDTLSALSKILKQDNCTFIEISGYTDAMSDQRAANALTFDMAQRVAVYLSEHGIDPVRLFVLGRGSARPISDQTDIGRLMNRRVELRISPVIK